MTRALNILWFERVFVVLLGVLAAVPECAAQVYVDESSLSASPRGKAELVVCTQNLENYGRYADVKRRMPGVSISAFKKKEAALIARFALAGCDVIAVQELLGSEEQDARGALAELARGLAARTGRTYEVIVGESNDPQIRQGFITAVDRAEIINKVSYAKAELPKISEDQKQRFFSRGPVELQLRVRPFDQAEAKTVTLINFHFKSRSSKGGSDPTGLEFEPHRMEMAEALRRIVTLRQKESLAEGKTLLLLLGDRNSNFDTASARILEGTLRLEDFQKEAPCRLSKRGVPLCRTGTFRSQRYFSVLTGDPQTKRLPGTIRYDNIFSWLDDILLPSESLPAAWSHFQRSGDYDSGVTYHPKEASDHALAWVRLNW